MVFHSKTTAAKIARRTRRLALWDRPIGGAGHRLRAWANTLFVDHAFIRMVHLNRHKVADGLWRSGQPTPRQVAAMARTGIRTIINLRGGREVASWPLEAEACARHGITLVEAPARSREAPTVEMVRELDAIFKTVAYPALIHCKAGADRAGIVAALYLILREGRSATEALEQLSPRYGHWRWSKTGVLDAFLEKYRDEGEAKGLGLIEWMERDYDPETLNATFRPNAFSSFIVDTVLRRE